VNARKTSCWRGLIGKGERRTWSFAETGYLCEIGNKDRRSRGGGAGSTSAGGRRWVMEKTEGECT
jgi:hypothetical protein